MDEGQIKEIIIWTNRTFTPTEVSNLHVYFKSQYQPAEINFMFPVILGIGILALVVLVRSLWMWAYTKGQLDEYYRTHWK